MSTEALVYLIIASMFAIPSLIASYLALTGDYIVKERKWYQLVFAWLVPVLGALCVIYFHREDWFRGSRLNRVGNHSNISHGESVDHGQAYYDK